MPIIEPIPKPERRLMQKTIYKTKDKNHARRLTAILMLHHGDTVSHVASTLCCAHHRLVAGLTGSRWLFEHICALLRELVKHSPGYFGYQRSRWSSELLVIKIREATGCPPHTSTIRRWLPALAPNKEEKMAAINCGVNHL